VKVTRISAAPAYFPPNHEAMRCLRLQGHEAGPSDSLWLGMSHILPGGGTSLDASPVEKMYVVLAGELTVRTETEETTLGPWDSCRLSPNEKRALENRTNRPVTVLLAMPLPAASGKSEPAELSAPRT
jgi:quercetin dioxygenase-like cupin family protein